jgi:hypothetical protein
LEFRANFPHEGSFRLTHQLTPTPSSVEHGVIETKFA